MTEERNVIRLVRRSLDKTIGGRRVRFAEPGAGDEAALDEILASGNERRFVSELISVCTDEPKLTAAEIDMLSEHARARARVAAAEVLGVEDDYRRLGGSGDARLCQAMRLRRERIAAQLRELSVGMGENVVRMAREAQRLHAQVLGDAQIARMAHDAVRVQRQAQRWLRDISPGIIEAAAQANRIAEQMRPALDWVESNRQLLADVADTQRRIGEGLARQIEPLFRPQYFGGLTAFSRQIDELIKPRQTDAIARAIAGIGEGLRPRLVDFVANVSRQIDLHQPAIARLSESIASMQRALAPGITDFLAAYREQLQRLMAGVASAYAAWLERHWPEVYANPDHPAPVLFLIASLPMAIGLPIYEAVVKAKRDDRLLDGLEGALRTSSLIDYIEQSVQASNDLDAIAKRFLLAALEAVRDARYIDAAPPLYQGLERAFTGSARSRGLIDERNEFQIVPTRTKKARTVDDLFEHLSIDHGFERYLRSWVFGEIGNSARHGDLPDEPAHRRWVLRAVAALLGWFEYCAGDAAPMHQLVARLELTVGEAGAEAG